ncbi:MAG: hypothetical protein ACTSYF_12905 [Promethearchaeota archaeon]
MAKDYKWRKKYSIAEIRNASFDETYRVFKIALYGWDSVNNQYVAIKVNSDGKLKVRTQ